VPSFRAVFVAVVIATALVVAAFAVQSYRPRPQVEQPTSALVRASGACAGCHSRLQYSVVHEYEMSVHAHEGVNCLQCHQPARGQQGHPHRGFVIARAVTPANCRSCHEPVYQQFVRSRHAAPSWAAVAGSADFTAEQIALAEQYQPGAVKRPPHPLVALEGKGAAVSGCLSCHSVGRPNADGSIGDCTACHTRHTSSVAIARLPTTCGQCHMGPDHSQLEIYQESKHGLMFQAQRALLNLDAPPRTLSTRDMFVPTCATCHMSGLNGRGVTHDPSERLSYFLFAEVSEKRPGFARAQAAMKDVCRACHTDALVSRVYREAETVVEATNEKVAATKAIVEGLRRDGLLPKAPFSTPLDFTYFDYWHYDGRTAKHGAFMGGADFVQWHGNYPLLARGVEIRAAAEELRRSRGHAR
jgi:hydroxylamine dehydrogenase